MSVSQFPSELKAAILHHTSEDKALLLRCRLISKDFQDIATPRAFRILNISRRKGCHAIFSGLPNDSSAFIHVKEINFRALETMHVNFQGDEIEETASMFTHLTKFSSLQTLRLYFPTGYEEGVYELTDENMSPTRALQIAIFKNLAAHIAQAANFSPRKLEIHGLVALPNEGLRLNGLRPFLEHLSSLHVSLATNDDEDFDISNDDYSAFWEIDMVGILSSTTNLTRFTLISDINALGFLNKHWDAINFPKLEYLCFKNFVFTNNAYYRQRFPLLTNGGIEEFILRHNRTLKDLDLSSCWVEIDDEDPHPRTWAIIWENFEKRLTRLRSFTSDPLPDNDCKLFEGYVHFVIESGYVNFFDADPTRAGLDRAAFESLQRMVENRNGFQK